MKRRITKRPARRRPAASRGLTSIAAGEEGAVRSAPGASAGVERVTRSPSGGCRPGSLSVGAPSLSRSVVKPQSPPPFKLPELRRRIEVPGNLRLPIACASSALLSLPLPQGFLRGRGRPCCASRLTSVRREMPSIFAARLWLPPHACRAAAIRALAPTPLPALPSPGFVARRQERSLPAPVPREDALFR